MMLTPYAGMVPAYYFNSPIRFHDYSDAMDAMMWPASNASAFSELVEPPPFSIWSQGNPNEQVSAGSLPSFLTPSTANITGWQDFTTTQGYPTPTGTPPQCAQTLPMTNNWSGAYVPNTTSGVLESWMENNPVETMLIGLAMLAAGAALSRAL